MLLRNVVLVVFSLLLAACAGKSADNRPQAWLKPGVRVTLPAPGMTPAVNQQQLLTSAYKGKEQSLLVMLSADEQRLSLAGLSSLGIRLFLITYDAAGIHTEQALVLPEMPPANQVLADIMLSHWPIAAWLPQLPAGWSLHDRGDVRQLRDNRGNLITEIRYKTRNNLREPVSVQQFVFGYKIAIQPLGGES